MYIHSFLLRGDSIYNPWASLSLLDVTPQKTGTGTTFVRMDDFDKIGIVTTSVWTSCQPPDHGHSLWIYA
jgi:hypothetical protein